MAAAHKGAISFGLVHIPVQLWKTTQNSDISFHQLCKDSKQRIRYKKMCPHGNKEVKSSDIVKGYEYEKDSYVILREDELEALKSEKDRSMHILQFTKLSEIDARYYEKNYYAIPEKAAEKAYELLRKAMLDAQVVAIAKTVLHTKETLLALCPQDEGIIVKTLFYKDEMVEIPRDIVQPATSKSEQRMANQLVKAMMKHFDPADYHDEYQQRLYAHIMDKVNGNKISKTQQSDGQTMLPMDLVEALKQSIATSEPTKKRKRIHH